MTPLDELLAWFGTGSERERLVRFLEDWRRNAVHTPAVFQWPEDKESRQAAGLRQFNEETGMGHLNAMMRDKR